MKKKYKTETKAKRKKNKRDEKNEETEFDFDTETVINMTNKNNKNFMKKIMRQFLKIKEKLPKRKKSKKNYKMDKPCINNNCRSNICICITTF